MRLLIADDEQELVRAIAAILRFYDYQIDTASNGLQALELLQQYSYDGAVLDIMMPGLRRPAGVGADAAAEYFIAGIVINGKNRNRG